MPVWLVTIGTSSLAILAIAAFLWGLFGDVLRHRFRRARRCPRCWYDMSESPSRTCSECGFTAKRERVLQRIKRSRLFVYGSMLLAISASIVYRTPEIHRRGWRAALPTTYLVIAAPVDDDAWIRLPATTYNATGSPKPYTFDAPANRFTQELLRRGANEDLEAWQWRIVLWRLFRTQAELADDLVHIRDFGQSTQVIIPKTRHLRGVLGMRRDMILRISEPGSDADWIIANFDHPGHRAFAAPAVTTITIEICRYDGDGLTVLWRRESNIASLTRQQ